MTILESIKSISSYPISDNTANRILTKRGLSSSDVFSQSVAVSQAFELAEADIYLHLVSGANISEGGYQISLTDKSNLMKLASGIYQKWGVIDPSAPTATFVQPW